VDSPYFKLEINNEIIKDPKFDVYFTSQVNQGNAQAYMPRSENIDYDQFSKSTLTDKWVLLALQKDDLVLPEEQHIALVK